LKNQLGLSRDGEECLTMVREVAEARNLSLRSVERICTVIVLSLAARGNRYGPPALIAGLSILKVMDPPLYEAARAGGLKWADASKALCVTLNAPEGRSPSWGGRVWAYFTGGPLSEEDKQHFRAGLYSRFSEDTEVLPWLARDIVDRLQPL
jgi:hypothetical protein